MAPRSKSRYFRRSPTLICRLLRISRRSDLDRRRSYRFGPAFGPSRRTLHCDLCAICCAVGPAALTATAAYNPRPITADKSNRSSSSRVVPQGVPLTICTCASAQAATEEAGRDRQITSRAGPNSDSLRAEIAKQTGLRSLANGRCAYSPSRIPLDGRTGSGTPQ